MPKLMDKITKIQIEATEEEWDQLFDAAEDWVTNLNENARESEVKHIQELKRLVDSFQDLLI